MTGRIVAIVLIVLGVAATAVGLFGRFVLVEDEGHHDGRSFGGAVASASGADELVVAEVAPGVVDVSLTRSGQPLQSFEELHDSEVHVFTIPTDRSSFHHEARRPSDGDDEPIEVGGAGPHRIVTQSHPSGGPDLLELGTTVELSGAGAGDANVTDDDVWTDGQVTVTRQGFDFVLSEPWTGDDVYGGPAFLSLFGGDDLAFTHAHAEVVGDDRFSFQVSLLRSGPYLAAVEFDQNGRLVTAVFRFEI